MGGLFTKSQKYGDFYQCQLCFGYYENGGKMKRLNCNCSFCHAVSFVKILEFLIFNQIFIYSVWNNIWPTKLRMELFKSFARRRAVKGTSKWTKSRILWVLGMSRIMNESFKISNVALSLKWIIIRILNRCYATILPLLFHSL